MARLTKQRKRPTKNAAMLPLEAGHPAFKEVFDSAKDAILAAPFHGAVSCYANRSACEMTGYSFDELMHLRFTDLVHPQDLGRLEAHLANQQKEIDLHCCCETRIVTKNGEPLPVEVTFSLSLEEYHGLSFASLRDIRAVKNRENELKKSLHMLNEELLKNQIECDSLDRELVQTQKAMSVLAKKIDIEKNELEYKVSITIASKVIPIINALLTEEKTKGFWPELNLIAEYLKGITTKNALHHKAISILTEAEMKIAAMVKNKMTSKEIAGVMCVSLETVKAHRKKIRRKLKIHNTKQKLSEYLATVMGE